MELGWIELRQCFASVKLARTDGANLSAQGKKLVSNIKFLAETEFQTGTNLFVIKNYFAPTLSTKPTRCVTVCNRLYTQKFNICMDLELMNMSLRLAHTRNTFVKIKNS